MWGWKLLGPGPPKAIALNEWSPWNVPDPSGPPSLRTPRVPSRELGIGGRLKGCAGVKSTNCRGSGGDLTSLSLFPFL